MLRCKSAATQCPKKQQWDKRQALGQIAKQKGRNTKGLAFDQTIFNLVVTRS